MAAPIQGSKQDLWKLALRRAYLAGLKPFWRVGDYYTVDSTREPGQRYEVTRIYGAAISYRCTCPAGIAGKICQHAAIVAALPAESRLREDYKNKMREE